MENNNPSPTENLSVKNEMNKAETLAFLNIEKIEDYKSLGNLINFDALKDSNLNPVKTEKDTLIVFDAPDWNNAYVLDFFVFIKNNIDDKEKMIPILMDSYGDPQSVNDKPEKIEFFEEVYEKLRKQFSITELVYVDNQDTSNEVFRPFYSNQSFFNAKTYSAAPAILILCPKESGILMQTEALFPISLGQIIGSYLQAHDASQILAEEKMRQEHANIDIEALAKATSGNLPN